MADAREDRYECSIVLQIKNGAGVVTKENIDIERDVSFRAMVMYLEQGRAAFGEFSESRLAMSKSKLET